MYLCVYIYAAIECPSVDFSCHFIRLAMLFFQPRVCTIEVLANRNPYDHGGT